jgi:glycosyltransferase involved in cell wall biosynthesis
MLFDHALDGGHNAQYCSSMIKNLLESGDEVSLVAPRESQILDEIRDLWPSIWVKALSPSRTVPTKLVDRYWMLHTSLRKTFRIADERSVDVLHHLFLDATEVPWSTASFQTRRNWKAFATLFWIHFDPNVPRAIASRALGQLKRSALRRLVTGRRLDGIFVHTERIRKRLAQLCGEEFLEACTVIPDPVPPSFEEDQKAARMRLDLPVESPTVLFFGALRRNKGPDLFLRSLASLGDRCTAVIAGNPYSVTETEIHSLASQLPENVRVILRLGWIPEEDTPHYFAAADVVAMPYRRTFLGTSGVLTWAVSSGRPILATDVGDVGHTVKDEGLGVVVTPESPEAFALALSQVLGNLDGVKNEVAPRARAYALTHSWEVLTATVRRTYLGTAPTGRHDAASDRTQHRNPRSSAR